MRQQFGMAWLVTKRELLDQMRDWRILIPMIVLTAFFPYLMTVAAQTAINYINQYGASLIGQQILPFLMLVVGFFPVTVSLVVALEAFVGEKERGTIEPLLTSPLADWQLYVGKLMAGIIIPLTVSYIGIALYLFGLWRQRIGWPDAGFTIQTLALTAVQTVLMVSAAIVISTQSTTVRSANLLASFIVIPVALLIQGESALMFWGTNQILWLAVFGVAVISALIVRLGLVHFKRENLLGREIDMLNLGWAGKTFWKAFSGAETPSGLGRYLGGRWKLLRKAELDESEMLSLGEALWLDLQGIVAWYRFEIPRSLRKMSTAIWITLALGIAGMLAAYFYVDMNVSAGSLDVEKIRQAKTAIRDSVLGGGISPWLLFWHNFQVELGITALGIFSFGILGIVVYIGNFSLIGGVLAASKIVGVSPLLVFITGILPHGIFELTSIILASSAVLYTGVELVTPKDGRTIGEAFIVSIADLIKILFGVCVPLLIVAALVEGWITPLIFTHYLGNLLPTK
ncbi:MAG: stage II sporulation protein M [Anaerolineales bacterium]